MCRISGVLNSAGSRQLHTEFSVVPNFTRRISKAYRILRVEFPKPTEFYASNFLWYRISLGLEFSVVPNFLRVEFSVVPNFTRRISKAYRI